MADHNGVKILKNNTRKLKSFFWSKDILSFLIFLALSFLFWFVNALQKERETIITIPVKYIGLPMDVAITNSPPTEIQLSVKDQGLQLFEYSKDKLTPLLINVSRNFNRKGEFLITAEQLSGNVGRYMHLKPTTSVIYIRPGSILIQYQKLTSKVLPVELVSNIELANQCILSDKIQIEPASVLVYGPKRTLDTMKVVRTQLLELKNLNDTVYTHCKLKQQKFLHYSVNRVRLSIFVEPFTERKIQLPATAINCPANLSIRTFPAFVNITYTVGLSHFKTLNPNDIEVFLDYNMLQNSRLSKQRLVVKNNSLFISNIRTTPEEVEFILEQK